MIVGNAIFTVLILALLVGGGAVVFGKSRFEAPGPLAQDKIVNIPPRLGMMEIADLLRREGVIDEHRLIFVGGVFALKARSELKAGEYVFTKRASVRDVVETIVEGKVVQHQLTIPEGLTSEQIVARLLESEILTGNIKDIPREGTLLPDSYHFHRGFTREQMIARMRQTQERLVREVWERRVSDLPVKTPEQLIILASIIEKETGRARGAHAGRRRVRQPAQAEDEAAIGPDHHLRPGVRQGLARSPDHQGEHRSSRPRTTPTSSTACRPDRSPIRAAPRSRPPPVRRAPRNCSSWPTAPAVMPSPRPTTSTRRTSRACA